MQPLPRPLYKKPVFWIVAAFGFLFLCFLFFAPATEKPEASPVKQRVDAINKALDEAEGK